MRTHGLAFLACAAMLSLASGGRRAGAADARTKPAKAAKAQLVWNGRCGGFVWQFTPRNLMARRSPGATPVFSAAKALKAERDVQGFASLEVSVRPLSLVGSLLTYREDDYWTGGAHPSGNIAYQVLDAANPRKIVSLTELFPDRDVLRALLADPIVRKVMAREKLSPPATSAALVKLLAGKEFGGEYDDTYGFPEGLLQEFAFHHVEGNQVAVRLCVPWGSEIHRFHSTEIGLLLPIPEKLKPALTRAADGREGFLEMAVKGMFGDRSALLVDYQGQPEKRR